MVNQRCIFLGCTNIATGPTSKTFFKVHTKNRFRDLEAWKLVCGVSEFPKQAVICSDHFQNDDFVNPLCKSQGLKKTASPSLNRNTEPRPHTDHDAVTAVCPMDIDPPESRPVRSTEGFAVPYIVSDDSMEVGSEVVIDNTQPSTSQIPLSERRMRTGFTFGHNDHDYLFDPERYVFLVDRLLELEEENSKLKKDLRVTNKKLSKKNATISQKNATIFKLRQELKQIKAKCTFATNPLQDPILTELQKNKSRKSRGARYSDTMKNMALVLQYCSTKAYRQMRQFLALPGLSTVRKWLGRIIIREGFSTTVFQLLKLKAATMEEAEKLVTLFIDEIALSERVTFFFNAKPDFFCGFPSKIPGQDKINTKVRAKSALTLMIKTIKSGFKQAIGYFFCNSMTSSQQKSIVDEALQLLVEAGFTPKVLTCDQNSINRNMFSKEYQITENAPYFDFEAGGRTSRVYCMFDAPHLLKSCRNNLLKHNAVWKDKLCSFQDIVDLYYEDVKHVPRTVPGLTYDHIRLSQFSEMNVGLAVQALSQSVVAGLKDYSRTGKLSKTALNTASFCEDFDHLFDIANSSNLKEKKELKRPLTSGSTQWQFLDAAQEKLRKLYFVPKDCFDPAKETDTARLVKNSRTPYFIDGWISYISALKLLWEELETQYDFRFLRTRNLSQDCLEHFFSVIRWRNGNNNHPDPSQFSSAYKAVVINQLLVPKKVGNVEADISKHIVSSEDVRKLNVVPKQRNRLDSDEQVESFEDFGDPAFDENQKGSIYWTTGWACSKLTHTACIQRVGAGNENVPQNETALTRFKMYNERVNIKRPGDKIVDYFKGVTQIFQQNFDMLLEADTVGVKEELMDIVQHRYDFFNESTGNTTDESTQLIMDTLCTPCALKITEKFFNMLICGKLGQINDSFKSTSDRKKKDRRSEKAKKLNIARLSQLLADTSEVQLEPKKKRSRYQQKK